MLLSMVNKRSQQRLIFQWLSLSHGIKYRLRISFASFYIINFVWNDFYDRITCECVRLLAECAFDPHFASDFIIIIILTCYNYFNQKWGSQKNVISSIINIKHGKSKPKQMTWIQFFSFAASLSNKSAFINPVIVTVAKQAVTKSFTSCKKAWEHKIKKKLLVYWSNERNITWRWFICSCWANH